MLELQITLQLFYKIVDVVSSYLVSKKVMFVVGPNKKK